MPVAASGMPWYRQLWRRYKAHRLAKSLGIPSFIAVFFAAYFLLLAFPQFPVTIMPLTALDRWIGFQPGTFWLYASLWVYVCLPPSLLAERDEIFPFVWSALGLSVSAMLIFLLLPTTIPPSAQEGGSAIHFLRTVDAGRNACPSLHVAFALLSGVALDRLLRRVTAPAWTRLVNALWCVAIVYSTLAIKQHVALDALGGLILGGWWVFLHRYQLAQRDALPGH